MYHIKHPFKSPIYVKSHQEICTLFLVKGTCTITSRKGKNIGMQDKRCSTVYKKINFFIYCSCSCAGHGHHVSQLESVFNLWHAYRCRACSSLSGESVAAGPRPMESMNLSMPPAFMQPSSRHHAYMWGLQHTLEEHERCHLELQQGNDCKLQIQPCRRNVTRKAQAPMMQTLSVQTLLRSTATDCRVDYIKR